MIFTQDIFNLGYGGVPRYLQTGIWSGPDIFKLGYGGGPQHVFKLDYGGVQDVSKLAYNGDPRYPTEYGAVPRHLQTGTLGGPKVSSH